mmetsp:Transcript_46843/g.124432  ORF Transcript_46843/g.124432 Transcript_46843/m.124432 type:complete len:196 (+) Transcript_46843:1745-2332(+)
MFLYLIALTTVVVIFPLTQAPPLQPFSSNSIIALCVCESADHHDVASFNSAVPTCALFGSTFVPVPRATPESGRHVLGSVTDHHDRRVQREGVELVGRCTVHSFYARGVSVRSSGEASFQSMSIVGLESRGALLRYAHRATVLHRVTSTGRLRGARCAFLLHAANTNSIASLHGVFVFFRPYVENVLATSTEQKF